MTEAIIKEDFAPDAAEIRKAVIAGGFSTVRGPDGAEYTGVSFHPVPHWHELIARAVGFPIVPTLCGFRLNLAGELPHSWVHSDDICATHASILYLNTPEQCQGGTAFWKHAGTGIDRLPPDAEIAARGVDVPAFHQWLMREWKKQEAWEKTGLVEMKWNRFAAYSTALFHSRYPWEAFGTGPEDGRIIWVCFFNRKEEG